METVVPKDARTVHPTHGLSAEEKINRCREWVKDGKFSAELGAAFTPSPETVLSQARRGNK